MSEQSHGLGRERRIMRNVLIAGAAAAVAVAAVAGTKKLAEMPEDAYSSMEGVQVAVPSNVFEQVARKITGKPNFTVSPGTLTDVVTETAKLREYELDPEAAVSYAIENNPALEPYRTTDLPAGETFQVPLPSPEIEFIGALEYPFMMTTQPDLIATITNPDGSRNAPLQDAIYEANAPALFENNNVYPEYGSYLVGAYDLTKWVGVMPNMTDVQKNITADQAVALLAPPVVETTP